MPKAVPTIDSVYGHIGRRLRELRLKAGLTQAQVAQVISVSPQQYQKYEDAQSKCSLPYLLTLAAHFGRRLDDLLPGDMSGDAPQDAGMLPDTIESQADLLARLVSAFVRIENNEGRLRVVQLVETMAGAADNVKETG